ncbi:sulfite exporter TauE/SafE family protein, partial [Listeria monocytogenes]|nr:sulfite exporter TauE/SafE family protein [Listeria monocytogenes]
GAFKVMALDVFMNMPLKVSSATSNLMMGVPAAASATVYLFQGDIQPDIAAPVAIGVLVGATLGTRIMQRVKSKVIRIIFIPVSLYVAFQMILE